MERQATDDKPASLSVIVVSDYAAGEEKSWEDLRRALRVWVDQEGVPAEEFILVESSRFEGRIPSDVSGIVPNMTILYIDAESSYELKNRAVEAATGDWLAIADDGICATAGNPVDAALALVTGMVTEDSEIVTVLVGAEARAADTERVRQQVALAHSQVEVEVHEGGQPLYPYLIGVE